MRNHATRGAMKLPTTIVATTERLVDRCLGLEYGRASFRRAGRTGGLIDTADRGGMTLAQRNPQN